MRLNRRPQASEQPPMTPAEIGSRPAPERSTKPAETLESFTAPYENPIGDVIPGKPRRESPDAVPLIVGVDAKWVEQPEEPGDGSDAAEPGEPTTLPSNLVLSYQYSCWFNGQEWSGIIEPTVGSLNDCLLGWTRFPL